MFEVSEAAGSAIRAILEQQKGPQAVRILLQPG